MSWLDLHEDRIKELLLADYYPSIREIGARETGTIRRFRAECKTGYWNHPKFTNHDECCPEYIIDNPDGDYHPASPIDFLGDDPDITRVFLQSITEDWPYGSPLLDKDDNVLRSDTREPISADPVRVPVIIKRETGDWTGFAHWEQGGAFFSSWSYPSTENNNELDRVPRTYNKENHMSVDIITKDFLFYRHDLEQYIAGFFGFWRRMIRLNWDIDRDGPGGGNTKEAPKLNTDHNCAPSRKFASYQHRYIPQCRIWEMTTDWGEWVNGKSAY